MTAARSTDPAGAEDGPLALDSVVAAVSTQASCTLGGQAVILQMQAGVYFGLNEVGTRVWQLLEAPRSVRALRDALVAEYDVDTERCQQDLLGLLGELRQAGLLEVRAA